MLLRWRSRDEMLDTMSGWEYLHWAAYFKLKPPGDRLVASMLYNVNRKSEAPFMEPDEFFNAIRQKKKQDIHQQLAPQSPRQIAAIFEGAVKKKRPRRERKKVK